MCLTTFSLTIKKKGKGVKGTEIFISKTNAIVNLPKIKKAFSCKTNKSNFIISAAFIVCVLAIIQKIGIKKIIFKLVARKEKGLLLWYHLKIIALRDANNVCCLSVATGKYCGSFTTQFNFSFLFSISWLIF